MGDLQELPGRMAAVESQILQLRGEMRDGVSAIHARLGAHDQQFESIDRRFESIDRRFESIDRRFDSVDQRFDDLKTYMRMLHEEALSRIAVTKEAPTPNGRGRKKR